MATIRRLSGVAAVAVAICSLSTTTWAAPDAAVLPPGSEVSLHQAIDISLKLHPRRLEAVSQAGAAQEHVGVERAQVLPQVYGVGEYLRASENGIGNTVWVNALGVMPRFSGVNHNAAAGAAQNFGSHDNFLTGFAASQYLWDFGRVHGLIDQARFEEQAAEAQLRLTDLDLIYEVSSRYFGLLAADQIVKVYNQAIVQRSEHLREAQVFATNNLRPEIDVYVTKAQLSRSRLHLVQAHNQAAVAKAALDNAMGLSDRAPDYTLSDHLGASTIDASLDKLVTLAMRLRPDLNMLRDEALAAGARIKQFRSDYFPTFSATGGYMTMGQGLPAANNYYAGLVVTWPMFNGFETEHQVAEAKLRRQALEHQIEDLQQQVYLQVKSAFLNWQASVDEIARARETLEASQVELKLAQERYSAGLGNAVELEDAQRRNTDDSAAYVQALYDFAVAKAEVDRASARSLNQ